ncbi:MAG: type II secretion system protein, partial [Armatimonadota bacterium]|nr:type II secretion system protein [Armatimonadota bacterium]MDR7605584.1 type II secretion system protein [Armatimonadota bacterium]
NPPGGGRGACGERGRPMKPGGCSRRADGFTFVELLVAVSLFAFVSLFLVYTLLAGMRFASRSNERAAATTVATQVMEQIRASANPVWEVNWTPLPRTPIPLPTPYHGISNPSPYEFDVAVDMNQDLTLTLVTVTVSVWRSSAPVGAEPLVRLSTVLDDK